MTSNNLTLAKLRKLILITALVICPLLLSQTGNAQNVATATLLSGGSNSISITSNQSFTLTLSVTTNFESTGYTVFYQSTDGTNLFQAASRTNESTIFNDPTTSSAQAFAGDSGNLKWSTPTGNPGSSNRYDLGFTGDQFNNQAAGTFSLQMVTFNTLNAAPGTYHIFLDNRSIMTATGFTDVNMGGPSGPVFTVTVIPEPTTVALAVLGGGALLVAVWRRQRAQA